MSLASAGIGTDAISCRQIPAHLPFAPLYTPQLLMVPVGAEVIVRQLTVPAVELQIRGGESGMGGFVPPPLPPPDPPPLPPPGEV